MTRQATDDSLNKAANSFDSGIGSMGTSTEGKVFKYTLRNQEGGGGGGVC